PPLRDALPISAAGRRPTPARCARPAGAPPRSRRARSPAPRASPTTAGTPGCGCSARPPPRRLAGASGPPRRRRAACRCSRALSPPPLVHRSAKPPSLSMVRNTAAGEAAARAIAQEVPGATPEVRALDLASLASVRRFAAELLADHSAVDLLVNNAGLVVLSDRQTTADGFELHLGTNMLGHFALTGLLLPAVERGDGPRVVTLSSITHKRAHLDFDDLMAERTFR